jgi:hypothetical protein
MAARGACESHVQELPPTRANSDGGVLGGDLTVVGGSIRWTGNLFYRVDVAAHGGVAMAHGKKDRTF